MKGALREYGRTVAIFAAAGLVLSLLVGLLAGNPFGIMVVRAILFAILFGGVGAGMQYVVRRFLPELAGHEAGTLEAEGGEEAEAKPAGSTIDIVLPEELPPARASAGDGGEPLEELPGTGDAGGASAVEELEGAESVAESPQKAAAQGGLDMLPEMGAADGDAARGGAQASDALGRPSDAFARSRGARAKPADATREVLERQDPASLARAVRTVLKREEGA